MEGSMRMVSWSRYHCLSWSFTRIRARLRHRRLVPAAKGAALGRRQPSAPENAGAGCPAPEESDPQSGCFEAKQGQAIPMSDAASWSEKVDTGFPRGKRQAFARRSRSNKRPRTRFRAGCPDENPSDRPAALGPRHSATPFNERQRYIVNRLLDGFEGNLTSSKWALWRNARRTPRCATSPICCNADSSGRMKAAAAARAIRWPKKPPKERAEAPLVDGRK